MTAEFRISSSDRSILISIARSALDCAARRLPARRVELAGPLTPPLLENGAAFVTLKKSGELRGCIGTLGYDTPLWRAVRDAAWSAAREDRRFRPVDETEARELSIDVSVLSPLLEIPSPEKFVPGRLSASGAPGAGVSDAGRHGIVIEKAGVRGVFLPKVAEEMGWGREETLSALCKKAGLPINAWRLPGMRFWTFTAEVFGEGPNPVQHRGST